MGSRDAAAGLQALSLVAITSLWLLNGVLGATYSINTYINPSVTGWPVSDTVTQLMARSGLKITNSRLSASQPSATELATINAFIIYSFGQGSYWNTEGLASNTGKVNDLLAWINRGGSLILVNGANDGSNTFVPLLNVLVGFESNCIPRSYVDNTRIFRRFDPPSNFGDLPLKMFRFSDGDALTGLDCFNGLPIYSSDSTKKLHPISAAITWNIGLGAVTWTGADIVADNQNPAALVIPAAVVVQPPPSPPPSPPNRPPPSTRSPPPRRSPPPARSPPPSPRARSPPLASPAPPPPPTKSPPPPPPAKSPPPPPPAKSPPPPPPTKSPPPPPPPSPPPPNPPPPPFQRSPSPPPPRPPPPSPSPPPPRVSPSPPPPPSPRSPSPRSSPSSPQLSPRSSPPPARSPPPTVVQSVSPPPRGRGSSPPPAPLPPPTSASPPPQNDDGPAPPDYYSYYIPPPTDVIMSPPPKKSTGRRHL